jgi:diaminopimelate decarboxylase
MELMTTGISLPALEPSWVAEIRNDQRLLADIAHTLGGPFHVLYPEHFAENLRAFQDVLVTEGAPGQVYFGKKANKSGSWLTMCAEADAGVDVASEQELVHALRSGVRGDDLVVTGAAKHDDLLWLAGRHRCLIAVDAPDELERILAMARSTSPMRILLRVLSEHSPNSRFGFGPGEIEPALRRCAEHKARVRMEGFSFHLNGYEVAPRVELAAELVDRCVAARALGLIANSISIGGGFAVNYLDGADWRRFHQEYRDTWFHGNRAFTHFYPYNQSPTGADMLASILESRVPGKDLELRALLNRSGVRLLMEPGRALLDGAGFSVFPVQGFKRRGEYGIVTVSGLSMSVSEQWKGSEYLPDPVLWPATADIAQGESGQGPVDACVGGASCLDYDMLTWRKVPFARTPRHGDLLIYPNTAGYQMDKNETEFHQLPLPDRVVVAKHHQRWHWQLDRSWKNR